MSTLYLVDDHAMLRDGLRAVLESAGHQVVGEAGSLDEAFANLPGLQPEVLLLDLRLGQDSGLALLRALPALCPRTQCLILSMAQQARSVQESLRLGAKGYVLKGSPANELLMAIHSIQHGAIYLSAEVRDLAQQRVPDTDDHLALAQLSPRERQIVTLVVGGQSSSQIGQLLHLSSKTVDTYRSRLMAKLSLSDVPALVRWAIRVELIQAESP